VRVAFVIHQEDAAAGVFRDATGEHEVVEWRPASGEPAPDFDALVTFGGGMHADQEDEHPWLRTEKELLRDAIVFGKGVLGVCLGAQLLAEAAGARVMRLERPEIGWREVELTGWADDDPLFEGLPRRFAAFQWHSYGFELPRGGATLARNEAGVQAFRFGGYQWGIQFHAEVTADSVASWIERYKGDDDVGESGVDLDSVARETERRIGAWNELGRTLCARFLAAL
jgi:GMP synthase (glutamine-hydrolysing)